MEVKKELIKREIAGDVILVPVGKSVIEDNGLYALNELGAFIWDILAQVENEEDIVKKVLEEYDVEEDVARKDVQEFLVKMKELKIL